MEFSISEITVIHGVEISVVSERMNYIFRILTLYTQKMSFCVLCFEKKKFA